MAQLYPEDRPFKIHFLSKAICKSIIATYLLWWWCLWINVSMHPTVPCYLHESLHRVPSTTPAKHQLSSASFYFKTVNPLSSSKTLLSIVIAIITWTCIYTVNGEMGVPLLLST
jgi:hypothetical protein